MSKIISFPVILAFLLFSGPSAFAEPPALSTNSSDPEKVGEVANMKGRVEIRRSGQAWHIAGDGQPVFMGDGIKTDSQGSLDILLPDQTTFKIGSNSAIIIDEFIFDSMDKNGEAKKSVAKGVFRYVSGKLAAKSSKDGDIFSGDQPAGAGRSKEAVN